MFLDIKNFVIDFYNNYHVECSDYDKDFWGVLYISDFVEEVSYNV